MPQVTSRPPTRSGYLPTLDGWRAVAIGLVFCKHTSHWPHALSALRIPLNSYGFLGVDVFFALSGLLICHRLLEEETLCGHISLRGFYLRRCFRILPAALVYLGVLAFLGLVRVLPTHWSAWWSSLLFARNYLGYYLAEDPQSAYTTHFWSLAVEEHFYLLLPAILVFVPRRRKVVLFALTVSAFIWISVFIHKVPLVQRPYTWFRRTDLHLVSLLFPAWLTLVMACQKVRAAMTRAVPAMLVPLCLLGIAGYHYGYRQLHPNRTLQQRILDAEPDKPIDEGAPSWQGNGDRPVIHMPIAHGFSANFFITFVTPLLLPFAVLSTLLHPASWLGRLLETPPLRYVGRLSYSLYLWQQMLWNMDSKGWPIARVQDSPVLGMLLTIAAAIASFYLVERPLIRLGHRLAPPATSGHRDTPVHPASLLITS